MSSWLWVQMGLYTSVIPSVLASCAWAFGVVLLLVLGFTRSPTLSVLVVSAISCIVVVLVAFMTVVMRWDFGVTEALSVTVFVGFSVDYSLHLAQAYTNATKGVGRARGTANNQLRRSLCVRQALLEVGAPVVAAAVTTAGAAAFLTQCIFVPLVKMGYIIMCNTFLSLLFCLGPLACALELIGPLPKPKPGRG